MRSCCAVYVDTGYLLASAATRVTGTSLRSGVRVDHTRLIDALISQAEAESNLPLLRVNWYDSGAQPGGGPDRVQESIGMLPRVKLRLGRLSAYGEQKGVDLRLGLDLVTHARNGVIDLIYLVSGDDDLTEAVEEAQGHGVQVVVLAAPNAEGQPHAVSRHLQREADGLILIRPEAIDEAVTPRPKTASVPTATASPEPKLGRAPVSPAALAQLKTPRPRPLPPAAVPSTRNGDIVYSSTTGDAPVALPSVAADESLADLVDDVCRGVLATWNSNATAEARQELLQGKPYIPSDVDRALLIDLSARMKNYDIDEPTRFILRKRFWNHVDQELGGQETWEQCVATTTRSAADLIQLSRCAREEELFRLIEEHLDLNCRNPVDDGLLTADGLCVIAYGVTHCVHLPCTVAEFQAAMDELAARADKQSEADVLPGLGTFEDTFSERLDLLDQIAGHLGVGRCELVEALGGGWVPVIGDLVGNNVNHSSWFAAGEPPQVVLGVGGEYLTVAEAVNVPAGVAGPGGLTQGYTLDVFLGTEPLLDRDLGSTYAVLLPTVATRGRAGQSIESSSRTASMNECVPAQCARDLGSQGSPGSWGRGVQIRSAARLTSIEGPTASTTRSGALSTCHCGVDMWLLSGPLLPIWTIGSRGIPCAAWIREPTREGVSEVMRHACRLRSMTAVCWP